MNGPTPWPLIEIVEMCGLSEIIISSAQIPVDGELKLYLLQSHKKNAANNFAVVSKDLDGSFSTWRKIL